MDAVTKQILTTANRLLRLDRFGGEVEPMTCLQGAYRPWTPYSGPTHTGCGVVDLTAWNWRNRFHLLDLLGMTPFHRTRAQGDWVEHMHVVTSGMGCVNSYAKTQIVEAKAGGDGLKGNKPDPDAALRSGLWPLAVYQGRTGILQAKQATRIYDGPGTAAGAVADVPAGYKTNAIMEVRNRHGNLWFVTSEGRWGVSSKWVKA